jgi:hypothetical protein
MNRAVKAVACGLVAVAMFLGVMAGTASADQPDGQRFPPFSNACLKVGGFMPEPFIDVTGQVAGIGCGKVQPGFSDQEIDRVARGCRQWAEKVGATTVRFRVLVDRGPRTPDQLECLLF